MAFKRSGVRSSSAPPKIKGVKVFYKPLPLNINESQISETKRTEICCTNYPKAFALGLMTHYNFGNNIDITNYKSSAFFLILNLFSLIIAVLLPSSHVRMASSCLREVNIFLYISFCVSKAVASGVVTSLSFNMK